MTEETISNTDEVVDLNKEANKPASEHSFQLTPGGLNSLDPAMLQALMAAGAQGKGYERHNHPTKKYVPRATRIQKRKAQRKARAASRGTTTSRKGQKFRINHSAAK